MLRLSALCCALLVVQTLAGAKGVTLCTQPLVTLQLPADGAASSHEASNASAPPRAATAKGLRASATLAVASSAPRPHIVMAVFDDMGWNDLGSFSGGQQTPRTPFMDELMSTGIKLKQYYVQPICSPTRSALMTGRYPMRMGAQHGVALPWDATWIPEGELLLPERLASHGYRCVAAGKWHLGHGHFKYGPTGRGFREFFGAYSGGADHWEHIRWIGGGPHRDAQRRSQHVGRDSRGAGASVSQPRPKIDVIDHHHDRWSRDGTFLHEHITTNNMTHSTDAFTQEAIRMLWEHNTELDGPLFLYLPFTAPHWPTQFWQHHADANRHIPGVKRQEFAGMVTHLDEALRQIVAVLKRKQMWDNTLFIAFADNGGDITTAASNWPYRGTKGTVWEGGTRAAAFIHSPNRAIIPESRRGTESHALMHVTDWLPTLLGLAGASAAAIAAEGKPLDGVDMMAGLLMDGFNPTTNPRKEMLYAMDMVVPKGGTLAMAQKQPNTWYEVMAIRVGHWKLIEGLPGRGDWYGEDPSLAWPVDYIMGPDATDYAAILHSRGGKVGDGGQLQLQRGEIDSSGLKRRWLFDLSSDPTEHHDLSELRPDKVKELLARLQELQAEQVLPSEGAGDVLSAFKAGGGRIPDAKIGSTSSGRMAILTEYWSQEGFPERSQVLLDGEAISLMDPPSMPLPKARPARSKL